jgi:hypothetical protein
VLNQTSVRLARLWAKDEPVGSEFSEITLESGTLAASGVALGSEPVPYRLEYELTTADGYITTRLQVRSRGAGWQRAIVLERDTATGEWSCTTQADGGPDLPPPGGDLSGLRQALDCDLGLSPVTNSMPVLRHQLHTGNRSIEFVMAWVGVPALTVTPSPQRYTFVRSGIVRYESLDADFQAEITFDEHGIVLDYPGIARSVSSAHWQKPSA